MYNLRTFWFQIPKWDLDTRLLWAVCIRHLQLSKHYLPVDNSLNQNRTSCTSVGVFGSWVCSGVVCLWAKVCLDLGSCGWVSLARTRSTWRATSSAAAAGVRVSVQRSLTDMRTRKPRAAAVMHAAAIKDGGTRRNSVSVDKKKASMRKRLNFLKFSMSSRLASTCLMESNGHVYFMHVSL